LASTVSDHFRRYASNMPPTAASLLRQVLRGLAALRAASAGLAYAPSLDERAATLERAREELIELERCAAFYEDATGKDLLADAERMLAGLPVPKSWLDACLGRLLLCLAARVELAERAAKSVTLDPSVTLELAREAEHVNAARAALLELGTERSPRRALTNEFLTRWLDVALLSLNDAKLRAQYRTALHSELEPLGVDIPN
jgi:hypothetical protein